MQVIAEGSVRSRDEAKSVTGILTKFLSYLHQLFGDVVLCVCLQKLYGRT